MRKELADQKAAQALDDAQQDAQLREGNLV